MNGVENRVYLGLAKGRLADAALLTIREDVLVEKSVDLVRQVQRMTREGFAWYWSGEDRRCWCRKSTQQVEQSKPIHTSGLIGNISEMSLARGLST